MNQNSFKFMERFDSAPADIMDDNTRIIAKARMEQILATPQRFPSVEERHRRVSKPRATSWKWAAIPVAIAAGIVGGVLTPGTPSSPHRYQMAAESAAETAYDSVIESAADQERAPVPASSDENWLAPVEPQITTAAAALATWEAVPTALTTADLGLTDLACRQELTDAASAMSTVGPDGLHRASPTIGNLLLAERRGDFGFLAYATSADAAGDTVIGSCFVWFPAGAVNGLVQTTTLSTFGAGSGGGTSANPGQLMQTRTDDNGANLSQIGPQSWSGAVTWDDTFAQAFGVVFNDDSALVGLIGQAADPNVVSVTVDTEAEAVTPTLQDGWFVAWWPVTIDADDAAAFAARQAAFESALAANPFDDFSEFFNTPWRSPFAPFGFTPNIQALTLTYADGRVDDLVSQLSFWPLNN